MRKFKSIKWSHVTVKSWLAVIKIPRTDELPVAGSTVVIDDHEYEIKSVECSWMTTKPLKRFEEVGIVVLCPPLHERLGKSDERKM